MHKATLTRNVLKAYRAASEQDRAEGLSWYTDTRDYARTLDSDLQRAAGVIAALSPRLQWTQNVNAAANVYAGRPAAGLGDAKRKAARILAGEAPLDVLGGPKVRAFYQCIILAGHHPTAVCVDMHAHDIALGRVTDDATRTRNLGRKGGYELIAGAYVAAARILAREGITVTPAQVQATTWVHWRKVARKAVAA